tara:strand:+ start:22171 stop:22899 length:729 start_codon:yes stop_codon:yes gene_type:complete
MKIKTAMFLAGGKGTRFKEKTQMLPKPMIEANGKPLLIYIMEHYIKYGIKNFIVLSGYKHEYIIDYFKKNSEIKSNTKFIYKNLCEVHVLYTGLNSMTGWRIKEGLKYLKEDNFFLTYGDGISDVNLEKLTNFHFKNKTLATLTAVRPPARFGSLEIENKKVVKFGEKNQAHEGWINGGYFVINKKIDKYLRSKQEIFEKYPLEKLASKNQLSAFQHFGFWQPVDTIRELEILEKQLKKIKF